MELPEELSRDEDSHKGENGKIAVIAGSKDFTGAPALVAQASLRSGSDLAKIVTSEEISSTVASYSENLIVDSYPSPYLDESGVEKTLEIAEWGDAGVIGPGLGRPEGGSVRNILDETDTPFVVDADAIEHALEADVEGCVFTPHEKEAEAIRDSFGSIENFVEEKKAVVLLKGPIDRIYHEGGVNDVGDGTPGMTVGGTGDVLTGVIASLMANGTEPGKAAEIGAKINGKAGEKAGEAMGAGLLATDLLEKIPEVFQED